MTDNASRPSLTATLRAQDYVIARRQVTACGITRHALAHRIRPGGPWQRLLPGVYLAQNGTPTVAQKEMAALLHAGPDGVLTGPAALRLLGITTAEPALFDVLVPMCRRPESVAFVAIHRTTRMPPYFIRQDSRSYAFAARALADTARGMTDLQEVRALIAGAIQQRRCPLEMLTEELVQGRRANSGLLRQVLAEAQDGVRSAAEAELRDLILRSGLPKPVFNAKLFSAEGAFIAKPDAWWPEAGVAAEVDSMQWHLKPADWERDRTRHDRMALYGILPLHFSPAQIRREPATVVATIAQTLRAGQARPPLNIKTRSAD